MLGTPIQRAANGLGLATVTATLLAGLALSCDGPSSEPQPAPPAQTPAPAKAPPVDEPPPKVPAAVDAPDLGAALDAAVTLGVIAPPEGGSTFEVDPFVLTWVSAAVADSGDRWLTRYESAGADGVEVKGWQVRVPEDSPLRGLGLRDGDVIEKVGGAPASDVKQARLAASRAVNELTLTVYRVDVTLTLSYRIEPGLAWRRKQAELSGEDWPDDGAALVADADVDREPAAGAGEAQRGSGGKALPPATRPSGPSSKPSSNPASKPSSKPASKPSGSSSKPSSRPSSKPSSGKSSDKVTCSGSVCNVQKAYFDAMVGSPSKLQSQANVVPAIRNDVHSGYKLKSVKSGSAVHKMGFRSGDKVTHVNGYDLTNDFEALALYSSLGSTKKFNVRYVRGGSTRTKTINVK